MDKSDAAAITAFSVKIRERRAARRPAWVREQIDQLTALNTPVKRSLLQELGHVGAQASTKVVKLASTKLAVEGH
jgi:hypothetical protein